MDVRVFAAVVLVAGAAMPAPAEAPAPWLAWLEAEVGALMGDEAATSLLPEVARALSDAGTPVPTTDPGPPPPVVAGGFSLFEVWIGPLDEDPPGGGCHDDALGPGTHAEAGIPNTMGGQEPHTAYASSEIAQAGFGWTYVHFGPTFHHKGFHTDYAGQGSFQCWHGLFPREQVLMNAPIMFGAVAYTE